jgi:hypothetical protein
MPGLRPGVALGCCTAGDWGGGGDRGPVRRVGVIHASAKFPIVRMFCGARGPSAGVWRDVDCLACLGASPSKDKPRMRARLTVEAEQGDGQNPRSLDPGGLLSACCQRR